MSTINRNGWQTREQQQEHYKLAIKAALMMLKKYKDIELELDNIDNSMAAWEDPLSLSANIVIRLADVNVLRGNLHNKYTNYRYIGMEKARFYMMLTSTDMEERYGPWDYENKLPARIPGPTLVAMRIATKIYWAWQHNVNGRDPVKQGI